MTGASLHAATDDENNPQATLIPTQAKRDKFSLNFITVKNKKPPDTVMKPLTGVMINKVIFTLLHNTFRLLPINDREVRKGKGELHHSLKTCDGLEI